MLYDNIMVPYDGSESARAALAAAVSAVLAIALRPALERAGVYRRLDGERQ